jgi:hypothetical protein
LWERKQIEGKKTEAAENVTLNPARFKTKFKVMEQQISINNKYQPGLPKHIHYNRREKLFVTKVAGSEVNLRWRPEPGFFINTTQNYYIKCNAIGTIQWHLLKKEQIYSADHLVGTDNVWVVLFQTQMF